MLNTVVIVPMPSASVSTATAVKPGFFGNWRTANFRSFITQRLHRIDFGRAAGGKPAGQERHHSEPERHCEQSGWISRFDTKKERCQNARKGDGRRSTQDQSDCDQLKTFAE